jgi:glycosyltransferase involved in cell wall biosynthesis
MGVDETALVDISVVVCTYNRSRQVAGALAHILEAAARTKLSIEIVVVDNNSRDDTKAVVESSTSSPIPIRYSFEPTQGLSFARNRGLKDSRGSVIAFTDDDCIVDPNWIDALWCEFVANPDVAIVGGRVDLYNLEDEPVSIRPFNERVRYTDATQIYGFIMGCNFAVRRSTTERIGGFDPAFGGSKGAVFDDIEFVYRAFSEGFGVLYTPEPRVFHNHGRRNAKELWVLRRGYAKGRGAFYCKYLLKADRTILRHAWWEVRAQVGSGLTRRGQLSSREFLSALGSGAVHFILLRLRIVRP